MRRPTLSLAVGLLVAAVASPAFAGGLARVNPAWLDALDLASAMRHAPHVTPAELAELDRRMTPLAAEQRRLIAEATTLDAEEAWLGAENDRIRGRKAEFERSYLRAVARLDEQMRKKGARLAEFRRLLGEP